MMTGILGSTALSSAAFLSYCSAYQQQNTHAVLFDEQQQLGAYSKPVEYRQEYSQRPQQCSSFTFPDNAGTLRKPESKSFRAELQAEIDEWLK